MSVDRGRPAPETPSRTTSQISLQNLPCGAPILIFKDVTEDGDQSDEEGEEGEEGEEEEEDSAGVCEVKCSQSQRASRLQRSQTHLTRLSFLAVPYIRWETYGWQLSKITDVITDATPHLFKKINFRLVWADKSKQGAGQSKRSELCIRSRRGSTLAQLIGNFGAHA